MVALHIDRGNLEATHVWPFALLHRRACDLAVKVNDPRQIAEVIVGDIVLRPLLLLDAAPVMLDMLATAPG